MKIRYSLTRDFQSAEFVRTGERPEMYRSVKVDPKTLTPAQRAVLETLHSPDDNSAVLWNPDRTSGSRYDCHFDRYLAAADVGCLLDQLAAQRLQERRETTQPLTFRIHTAVLDQVRAYAQTHGLKTDGEALRALLQKGLAR